MVIGLIAVPIVLRSLGEVDYGIYNVVSGIVTMLAFLNNALSSTTQRFLSFELGRDGIENCKKIFTTSLSIYFLFCILIVVLGETIGLWFVNFKLNIPPDRMVAANWIYQFSLVSFIFSVLSAPYNAAIIAHEKMNIYAVVCIGEALLKLGMVIGLLYLGGDRLILYGMFMMIMSALIFVSYSIYSRKKFSECVFSLKMDKNTAKQISGFAGWGIFGAVSNIFKNQGINIILNQFFGVLVNTARGLAFQVDAAVNTLIQNFFLATKPQLIKSYSAGDTDDMFKLVDVSTKVGYYLYFIVSSILIIDTEFILSVWLGNIPEHTVIFTRLVLAGNMFSVLAQPLMIVIHATGKVSLYQFLSGLSGILVLPISYGLLIAYDNVLVPFIVIIIQNLVYWIITIERSHSLAGFRIRPYLLTCIRLLIISCIIFVPAFLLYRMMSEGWLRLILLTVIIIIISACTIWLVGLSNIEKDYVRTLVIGKLRIHKSE